MADLDSEIQGKIVTYDRQQSIVDVFSDVVSARPSAIAVSYEDLRMTYADLDIQVSKLAAHLLHMGCVKGDRVTLIFEKGIDFVISILAVLKVGGVYVPVDPEYPAERIRLMLTISGSKFILVDTNALSILREGGLNSVMPELQWLNVTEYRACADDKDYNKNIGENAVMLPFVTGDDPAYIIFTSGTTGQPKGVVNAHNRVTNLVLHYREILGLTAVDCVSQIPSFSFDASVGEIFSSLLIGSHLHIFPSLKTTDPDTLTGLLEKYEITFSTFSPTALTLVKPFVQGDVDYKLDNIRTIIVGGEPFSPDLAQFYVEKFPHIEFHNIYGPTETTVFCTSIQITKGLLSDFSGSVLPIGYPVVNCSIRVSNTRSGGALTEIEVGGDCVSIGYFNDDIKTNEKFFVHNGVRYYRSGDLGVFGEKGYILIGGREDDQVKINGLRIELGEIASTIESHDSVGEAVVVVDRSNPSKIKVVGYCTKDISSKTLDIDQLNEFMREALPVYMLPAKVVVMEELPMTTSGKVDKDRLPAVDWSSVNTRSIIAPETLEERVLAAAFCEVLNIDEVSRLDNFYTLGGDSISALKMASQLRKRGYDLPQKILVNSPQLNKMAKELTLTEAVAVTSLVSDEPFFLAPIQQWFQSLKFDNSHYYHQSLELRTHDTINTTTLEYALNAVIAHHDQLRAYFPNGNRGVQQLAPIDKLHCSIEYFNLSESGEALENRRSEIGTNLRNAICIVKPPLIRAALIEMPKNIVDLVFVIHHAIVDTVSWNIIGQDIMLAYQQIAQGKEPVFSQKTTSYYQWTLSLHRLFADDDIAEKYLEVWAPELSLSSRQVVRTHCQLSSCTTHTTKVASFAFDRQTTDTITNSCNTAFSTTIEELLLCSVYHSLALWMDREDLCIDLEWHGRNTFNEIDQDISNTVGWFTAIYPLLVSIHKDQTIKETLVRLKEAKRSKKCNGASFNALRYLSKSPRIKAAFNGYQSSDVVFNYSGIINDSNEGWDVLPLSAVESAPENVTPYSIAIESKICANRLVFDIYYHEQYIDTRSVQQLLDLIRFELNQIVALCGNSPLFHYTPSDFPMALISESEARALPVETADVFPLSDIQSGIYVQSLSAPNSQMYHVQVLYEINKTLNRKIFNEALDILIRRHNVLRTRIFTERDIPLQVVDSFLNVTAEFIDFSTADENEIDTLINDFIRIDGKRLFNLETAPLFRVHVFSLPNSHQFRILLNIHHLIHDGWSLAIIMDELSVIYDRLALGDISIEELEVTLPSVSTHYSDYVVAQKNIANDPIARQFWASQAKIITGFESSPFPIDAVLRDGKSDDNIDDSLRCEIVVNEIPPDLYQQLKIMSRVNGVTLNSLLFTGFVLFLRAIKQSNQLVVGVVTSGRTETLHNSDAIVGCCLNTLPAVVSLDSNACLGDLLVSVHRQIAEIIEHCSFPLSDVSKLAREVSGDNSIGQLFDCTYDFESYQHVGDGEDNRPKIIGGFEMTNYGFEISLLEEMDILTHRFTYDQTQYKLSTINRWMVYFKTILENMVALTSSTSISSISAIPVNEQNMLKGFSGFTAPYPESQAVYHFIEKFARETPNRLALKDELGDVSYKVLNDRANQIANLLLENGVERDQPVAVLLNRSTDFIAAVVGIWKTGAAYMPIDPDYPGDRVNTLINNACARITVTTNAIKATFSDLTSKSYFICIDDRRAFDHLSTEDIDLPYDAENLAYVLFTSGSTGTPKGVMIEHRGMMNNIQSEVNDFYLDSDSVIAQTASQCFDVSVWQCFAGLTVGAKICVYSKDLQLEPDEFVKTCFVSDRVTNLQLVPSYVNELMNFLDESDIDLSQLRMLSITGEALKLPLLERWLDRYPKIPVINAYGPAEASDDITHHIFTAVPTDGVIPIGRPTQNANIYILDSNLQMCPLGVIGEICVSGICVGRGYIYDEERTAANFGTDPVRGDTTRFYRTGDLGRWREDGVLEFNGRKDYQVKVNGFRVELGEIENHISSHPSITEVAVVMHKRTADASPVLSAFISVSDPVSQSDIRSHIANKVPNHMVPLQFVILDILPTNTSGKIDKKRLQSWVCDSQVTASRKALNQKERILSEGLKTVFNTDNFNPDSSFFSVGGDSLKAIQLISTLKALGGKLTVKDIFSYPRFSLLAEHIDILGLDVSDSAIGILNGEDKSSRLDASEIVSIGDRDLVYSGFFDGFELDNIQTVYPLSSLQEGMLFHHMLESNGAYLGRYILEITGNLRLDILELSLNAILEKHDSLRSCFIYERVSRPLQIVLRKRKIGITQYDISMLDSRTREIWLRDLYERESLTAFDLERDALIRVNAIKLGTDNYQLFIVSHHIVMDGWSVANLIQDLLLCYGQALGIERADKKLAPSFGNYISWLSSQDKEVGLRIIGEYLDGYEPVSLKFPTPVPGAELIGFNKVDQELGLRQYVVSYGKSLTKALTSCAKSLDVTVNGVFRVIWGLLLQRYTHSNDVVFGNVISGRFPDIDDVDTIVGSLINTLPVRVCCQGRESVAAIIQRGQRSFVDIEKHGYIALPDIQKSTGLNEPLFDHILVSDNFPIDIAQLNTSSTDLGFTFNRIEGGAETNYGITVLISSGDDFTVTFEYKDTHISEQQLSCIGLHLRNLTEQICNDPTVAVNDLCLLTEYEQDYIVNTLSNGPPALIKNEDLLEQMEAVVSTYPDKIAVRFDGQAKTFREMDAAASQLALTLRKLGVHKNVVVPLIAERSFEMIMAILAILKAGGAYLPIDPSLPKDRINFILDDVNPLAVLVWDAQWINSSQADIEFPLSTVSFNVEREKESAVKVVRDANSMVYIIYTSGSTGQPKGVEIEDGALINRLCWMSEKYDISQKDTIMQKTVFTFDVSVWELLLPFLTGASMSLLKQGSERLPQDIVDQIQTDNVTVLHFVPSMLSAFVQQMGNISNLPDRTASLIRCFTSGEALNPYQAEEFLSYFPDTKLHNLYGPTEAAIDVSDYTVSPGDTCIPIGKPVHGTQLYVLDIFNRPAPIGIPGELHIGGVQLARGYHNRVELTCDRFSRGLFDDGRILYKTGDLCLWQEDGNIAYLGRMDHQVKIRGFRIELGEIENQLCNRDDVQDAVVIAEDSASGSKHLLAFYMSQSNVTNVILREYLLEHLPKYMLPSDFIQIDSIPQTNNGKVDRKALLHLSEQNSAASHELAVPENEQHKLLLTIWKDVLNCENIGIDHNFFNVRGDSILAIQIASRIQNYGYRFNVEEIFNYPTIRELTEVLEPLNVEIDQSEYHGVIPATPIQMWFYENIHCSRHHWNQSIVLSAPLIDTEIAFQTLTTLCQHHDILRSRVDNSGKDTIHLVVQKCSEFSLDKIEKINVQSPLELEERAYSLQSNLDLVTGPLIKAEILRYDDRDRLLLVIHHLVVDGVSWQILVDDFSAVYNNFHNNQAPQLPPKTHSFSRWQQALIDYSKNRKLLAEISYWNVLDSRKCGRLTARDSAYGKVSDAQHLHLSINETQTTRLLGDACSAYSTSVNELLLSAVFMGVSLWKNISELRIDLESHGREEIDKDMDITRTVGWFTSISPVLLECGNGTSIADSIRSVKEQLRGIPANGIGYGIMRYLSGSPKLSSGSKSQLLFNYLGSMGGGGRIAEFSVSSEFSDSDVGKNTELVYPIEIVSHLELDELHIKLIYSECCFSSEDASSLLELIGTSVNNVIDHCCEQDETTYTPSDFMDDDIDMEELDAILDAID